MGKLARGILGGFQGTTGTVYGCFWRMLDVIRAKPRHVKRPPTEAQAKVQMKLSIITDLLAWMASAVKVGFKDTPKPTSPMNAAVRYNLDNTITGDYPNYTVDYSKLKYSLGKRLNAATGFSALATDVAELIFAWEPEYLHSTTQKPSDMATFIVINPIKNKYVVIQDVVPRSALTYTLSIPAEYSEDSVHCYMSFVSADKKLVSDNVYAGPIMVL